MRVHETWLVRLPKLMPMSTLSDGERRPRWFGLALESVAASIAHLKRIMKLDRLCLRRPNRAKDEIHLAAAAQNLRKLAKLIPQTA